MMSLTFGLFTQVSDSGPQGPLVVAVATAVLNGFIPKLTVCSQSPFSEMPHSKFDQDWS